MSLKQDAPIPVHSVAEAYLHLGAMPCRVCGKGPVKAQAELTKSDSYSSRYTLATRCDACRNESGLMYEIDPPPTRQQAQSDVINPTSQPSRAIDLLGWLTLFRSILTASEKESDKGVSRQLAWEAAQCLDEAMKFYEGDNEMPPVAAFFTEPSRKRFQEQPAHFARSVWRERRLKLPDVRSRTKADGGKSWWKFWK
jgi:hypothetical protein